MAIIRTIIRECAPPIVTKTLKKFYPQPNGASHRKLHDLNRTPPQTLSLCIGNPVFEIPKEKIRYFGGIPFDEKHHPFPKFHREGIAALTEFYQSHQPHNVFEKHFLPVPESYSLIKNDSRLLKADATLPWLFSDRALTYRGENGLGREHGNQAFGPVSSEKIALEASRLENTLKSIKEHGYKPNQYDGYPRGYFLMKDNQNWVFYLRSGFHRVAALLHLGYEKIACDFMPNYPRIIQNCYVSNWPAVTRGDLTEDQALDIFNRYFD